MKYKIAIIFLSLIFIFSCKTTENKETETSATTPTTSETQATENVATPEKTAEDAKATPVPNGMTIEQPLEVKFEDGKLPEGWEWIDPETENKTEYEVKDGKLLIKVKSGKDLFGDNKNAPRLVKAITGDFEIETKVKIDPQSGYQGAGILVLNDDKNYLRLERGFGGIDGGENGVRFDKATNDEYTSISGVANNATEATELELKMVRDGKIFTAYMRNDENSEWKTVGEFQSDFNENVLVGILGVSTTDEIAAEFSGLKISPPTKRQ